MANPPVFTPQTVYDYIRDVSSGINASIDPLLLERNQLSKFTNGTVRGTFPTHRPPYLTVPLSFSDPTFRPAFEQARFQGAGYYKPDFGSESIIVVVAGRIFQIVISGSAGTVNEITVPGSANSPTAPQSWLWQAEKWMIINDSQNLPVFFDGVTSRQSYGPAVQVATINTGFNMPAIGLTVANVATNTTFSGPFNQPIRLTNPDGTSGIIQVVGSGGAFTGYQVTLKNLTDTAGATQASGTQITAQTNVVGVLAVNSNYSNATWPAFSFQLTASSGFPTGTTVNIPSNNGVLTGTISSESGLGVTVQLNTPTVINGNGIGFFKAGDIMTTPTGATIQVATLYQSFTAPAVNATVTAFLDRAYSGTLNQTLFMGGKQYQITAIGTPPPSALITILNVSYPAGAVVGNANPTLAASLTTVPELPVGKMGCYGRGRVWMALTDGRSFVAGDIVGGSSGLLAYNFRDAVLKMQENTLLNGGGSFVVPGQVGDITAMIFTAVLDTSLGQGPLAVCTPNIVFTCNAPVDRTTWQDITNPILTEGMKGAGALGQNSTIICNSDVMMRSLLGISSYIQGRRDFAVWGNVPSSREVDLYLAKDPVSLLQYASAAQFDNRLLLTTEPVQTSLGVCWKKLVALNFDPISSLRGKAPSVYDGIWEDLNILQLVKGTFGGTERLFAVCLSGDLSKIELHEILPSSSEIFQDDSTTPIVWEYETAAVNFYQDDPRKRNFMRLLDGELRIDQMDQTLYETLITECHSVKIETFYKTDQWPTYQPWRTVDVDYDPSSGDPGFRPALGLGEPSWKQMDDTNNRPLREGTTFQFKFRITGHCRVVGHRFKGVTIPAVDFAPVK